jgi:hypothetical protein
MFKVDSTADAGRCFGVPAVSNLPGVGAGGYLLLADPDRAAHGETRRPRVVGHASDAGG